MTEKKDKKGTVTYNLTFSKMQKRFLLISAIVTLTIFIIQIANLIFVFINPPPEIIEQNVTLGKIVNIFTPSIIMLTMSFLGMLNVIFLLSWRKKVSVYRKQEKQFSEMIHTTDDKEPEESFVSYSELAYQNISHMKRVRIFSYITNAISVLYIWWTIRGFMVELGLIITALPVHRPPLVLHVFNILAQVLLVAYLIFQWIFFHKWNKKIAVIEYLEKQIIDELDLE